MKRSSLTKAFFRKARKVGQIANDLTRILPNKDDNILNLIVKAIAGLDIADRHFFGMSKSKREEFFEEHEVLDKRNSHFVDIFFSTPLYEEFKVEQMIIDDTESIVVADNPDIGTLYFIESNYGGTKEPSTHFWFSPGFKFDAALDLLWKIYDKRIHVNMVYDKCVWRLRTVCSKLPTVKNKLVGKNLKIVNDLALKQSRYSANKVARTYLFVGNPGVGKSMAALKFADMVGSKTLRIDASGLTMFTMDGLTLLLTGMKPDVVIMDDVDKVGELASSLPTLLTLFQDMHRLYPEVVFILTAASLNCFDSAMIRPERVDVIVRFDHPDEEDRRNLIQSSLNEYGLSNDVNVLVEASEGLTAAYIQEACLRLRYDSQEDVIAYLKEMSSLFGKKPDKKEDKSKTEENKKETSAAEKTIADK